jgi:hypothetical protein
MSTRGTGLISAVRGPILLIGLGILFAMDHAGGRSFSQTWPALIVLFGVLKLLERVIRRQDAGAEG